MGTYAYKRVPWKTSEFGAETGEEVELADISETAGVTVGEGVATEVTAETALLGEGAATETFLSIEAAAAGLDSTGVGLPIGLLVGGLAALGFGAYEIYHYAKSTNKYPKLTEKNVNRHYNKAIKGIKYQPLNTLPDPNRDNLDIEPLEKQGLVPPPYKYLGPGNSLNRGTPYNNIDSDAKTHDIQYSNAETKEDIHQSDKEFLQKSGDHIVEGISGQGSYSDTIGAVVGGTGIGVKHLYDKLTGSISYPNLGKLWLLHIITNLLTLLLQTLSLKGLVRVLIRKE